MSQEIEMVNVGFEVGLPAPNADVVAPVTRLVAWRKLWSVVFRFDPESRLKWNAIKSLLEIVPSLIAIKLLSFATGKVLGDDDDPYNYITVLTFQASVMCSVSLEIFMLISTIFKFSWSHRVWLYAVSCSVVNLLQILFCVYIPVSGFYELHMEYSDKNLLLVAFMFLSKMVAFIWGFAHLAYLYPLCFGKP